MYNKHNKSPKYLYFEKRWYRNEYIYSIFNIPGYRGPNCEENINECEENNPCYTGSQCFDRYGDYICNCPLGFGGKNCDQEVNDCDSSPCQNLGTCMDNVNGYLCNCRIGFAGKNCEENIDDCLGKSCPDNSHCVDGINSFSCVCDPGYSGIFFIKVKLIHILKISFYTFTGLKVLFFML